ncbi:MAG: hypothetical protein JWO93_1031 [Micrococcaceae bacterium]|nr:hypothetical protein [Micrococcaceae bacterium]
MTPQPPALDAAALRRALTAPVGPLSRLEVVEETGSTNADLAAVAGQDAWPDLAVLVAENQLAGRGRMERDWSAPARSSLIMSALLRPPSTFDTAGYAWLSLLAAVALVDVLQTDTGIDARLKWPNDVLIEGRKVAGILAQLSPQSGAAPAVVVGVGVNVHQDAGQLPVATATSITVELGRQQEDAPAASEPTAGPDRGALLAAFLLHFADLYRQFCAAGGRSTTVLDGGASLLELVSERMSTLGAPVQAELPGGVILTGNAVGLDNSGALLITDAAGTTHAVAAGDVIHLRRGAASGGPVEYA